MADILNFTTYQAAETIINSQAPAETYGSLALALENNPGWSVIEGSKITTIGETTGVSKVVPLSNYVQTAAELEGGIVGATEAVEVAETGVVAGEVTAGASGLFAGWTIGTAVAGVLAGAGLGIAMYDTEPEFWVDVSNAIFPGEDIDYDSIKDYTIVGLIKESLFGSSTEVTSYLSEDIAKRILDTAAQHNMFTFAEEATLDDTSPLVYPDNYTMPITLVDGKIQAYTQGTTITYTMYAEDETAPVHFCLLSDNNVRCGMYCFSTENFTVRMQPGNYSFSPSVLTRNGITYYCYSMFFYDLIPGAIYNLVDEMHSSWDAWDLAYIYEHGVVHNIGGKGVYELPDIPQIYDPAQPFPAQYPAWADRAIETNGYQLPYDDPTLYPIPWIPVKMPEADPIQTPERYPSPSPSPEPAPSPEPSPYPEKEPQPDAQRGKVPSYVPDPYAPPTNNFPTKNPEDGTKKPDDKNPPTDPTPTPPIVFPTLGGEANALFTVYKPVIAELNSLAGVLWSSNFLENLLKIFTNNPMDAVISLHMLYATPHIGGRKNIKLGYLDTGIASDYVDKQYLEINCGTVRIPEYFGDARDYVNSVVDVYLPFVGMRHLKTQDIVGSYVTIKAGVDVFTGTILYTINIKKSSGIDQVMYAFEGNCAVALPLTGADKSRMFSVLGAAATGAAIGGVTGAAVGAFGSVMNGSQQADIQRSGNFGANAGAMGVKKPYIVVSRNVGYDANNYSHYHGYPANKTVTLSSCSGFTRILDVRLQGMNNATKEEILEAESLLKAGVIF